jgi:hypothetical protein
MKGIVFSALTSKNIQGTIHSPYSLFFLLWVFFSCRLSLLITSICPLQNISTDSKILADLKPAREENLKPTFLRLEQKDLNYLLVNVSNVQNILKVKQFIREQWNQLVPNAPFDAFTRKRCEPLKKIQWTACDINNSRIILILKYLFDFAIEEMKL